MATLKLTGLVSTRTAFWALWLALIVYATFFAPPDQSDSLSLITQLSSGQWQGINPYIVALFNIMGLWPMIYSGVMLTDGQTQSIRAWPFVVTSFAVGAFAILPYLALRRPALNPQIVNSRLLGVVNSRWVGVVLLGSTVGLLAYAIIQGNWSDFIQQWQRSRFIHVMSLDFCLLCLLFPVLLKDDLSRRGISTISGVWNFARLPLIGAVLYLAIRPPLKSDASGEVTKDGTAMESN